MQPSHVSLLTDADPSFLSIRKEGATRSERGNFWSTVLGFGGIAFLMLAWPGFARAPVPLEG